MHAPVFLWVRDCPRFEDWMNPMCAPTFWPFALCDHSSSEKYNGKVQNTCASLQNTARKVVWASGFLFINVEQDALRPASSLKGTICLSFRLGRHLWLERFLWEFAFFSECHCEEIGLRFWFNDPVADSGATTVWKTLGVLYLFLIRSTYAL